jgi:hypothetical protein
MTVIINGTDNSASTPAVTGTDGDTGMFYPAANTVALSTGGSERMRVDSSGNVGIGTTSPSERLDVQTTAGRFTVKALGGSSLELNSDSAVKLKASANDVILDGASNIIFDIADAEKARITSGGYFKASNNGTYVDSGASYHEFNQSSATAQGMIVWCSSNSYDSNVLLLRSARNTTNASYFYLRCFNTTSETNKLLIADSGNVTNTNNSYGSISDVKLKQDIVDAGSQWDDIKNLRVRKYRWKSEPDGFMQLGLVAQEAELVSPGLVEEHQDRDEENNFTGETTKAVKYSVLYMKAVKALQEAMERIETLEAKVAALEGAE